MSELNLKRFYKRRCQQTIKDHSNTDGHREKPSDELTVFKVDEDESDEEMLDDGEVNLNNHWLQNSDGAEDGETTEEDEAASNPEQVHQAFKHLTSQRADKNSIYQPSNLLAYNIVAPGAVKTDTEIRGMENLSETLTNAILNKQYRYARALIEQANRLNNRGHANIVLNAALDAATQLNDVVFVRLILSLETNTGIDFLELPIYTATTNNNTEILSLLIPRLTHTRDKTEITISHLFAAPTPFTASASTAQIKAHHALHRASLVAQSFQHASAKKYGMVKALLFEPISAALANQYTDGSDTVDVLENLAKHVYATTFTREQCLHLLCEPRLPRLLRFVIRDVLENTTPKLSAILTGRPVREYPVHWDVLAHHSRFFALLGRIAGVPLRTPEGVDHKIMRVLLEYMYTGEIDLGMIGVGAQGREDLYDLWDAAEPEVLDMPGVRVLVAQMLGVFGDAEEIADGAQV
ncbi:BTB/POZ domain-containing protein [Aspergillus mulundensis]|uniref:BTB domain-containing protein n=1 Tax=Aspergillus mulundensis TaxID=1810919 RepID=A0A3D8SL32_9EURO|nr:hypothetical protein DSM5745_03687 [Aspergillus mulundensis]RDW87045.1 hypothetical protein DSM5745_03687 [Aspergillus mulundensis]